MVLMEERDLLVGDDAIQWLLVTTLPIETSDDGQRVIAISCQRWQIEVDFRTLKPGCRAESRQFN